MAIPPWTIELLRRGLSDVARKASEPETIEKIKTQATEILQDLPNTAARGIDAVMRSAEAGKKSVERWSRKHTALAVPMLNATGVLMNEFGGGVPCSDVALQAASETLAGGVVTGPEMDDRLSRRFQRLLPAGGEYAIAVTSSFPSALTAFSLLVEQRQLVIHRSHAVRLPTGLALPDSFGVLLPVIQEVGGIDGVRPHDFAGLDSFCAIMADGGQREVELLDLSNQDAMQAVVLPVATLSASAHQQIPSAESMLSAGADFVILPGDGLCGGPPCGLLIGRRHEIERIKASNAWPALAASEAIAAMMLVTLETTASSNDQDAPLAALMNASDENLRSRAERMATRLEGSDSVINCRVTTDEARLTTDGRWRFPSQQLRLRHASMTAEAWVDDLRQEFPAVMASCDGNDVVVDLRWIAAADDAKLATALGGAVE